MQTLTAVTAASYLAARGSIPPGEPIALRELPGGVSNVVLLVERQGGERFVLKQALPRLRVEQEWLCSMERIWREVEVLRLCGRLLDARLTAASPRRSSESGIRSQEARDRGQERINIRVPSVLFEDRENYCFAMTAAPAEHRTWKELLLGGETSEKIAAACGQLLGRLHAGSWNDAQIAQQLDDRTFFHDLRVSPYFDRIREVHPGLASRIQQVGDAIWQHRCCLVHGDFSPKNLLVAGNELWLIDFEVGHYGDGSFDLGFFLTHLVLKALLAGSRAPGHFLLIDEFRRSYDAEMLPVTGRMELQAMWRRTCGALAGCLLARVDGKSPVDYLPPLLAATVRHAACDLLQVPPGDFDELLARVRTAAIPAAAPRAPSS